MNKDAVILLSGGLDSALNLAIAAQKIAVAITVDYGQRAAEKEISSAKLLAEYYGVKLQLIKVDYLKDLTSGALLGREDVPTITEKQLNEDIEYQHQTAAKVWVPNRNGLFINIAASFAEAMEYKHIYVGFNIEEAQTFADNSAAFLEAVNNSLSYSTRNAVNVISETINMTKQQMLEKAIEIKLPMEHIWSCYLGDEKPCGTCESCMRFKRAYKKVTGVEYAY